MTEIFWWAVLIISSGALIVILPYMVLLFVDEIGDTRQPVYMIPTEPNRTPRLPVAKLTGREYRRICRETAKIKNVARPMRYI